MTAAIPRSEYPRPQFVRNGWMSLNGEWEFDFDDTGVGGLEQWQLSHPYSRNILVPFCPQGELSGIGDITMHDIVWYRKAFERPESFAGRKILLHFGAVDYRATVWVNGKLQGTHEGGHTPFAFSIEESLVPGRNLLTVKVEDFSRDLTIPRGKQYWKAQSEDIFYTRTTGIWQSVWLEAVEDVFLERVKYVPDIDSGEIDIRPFISGRRELAGLELKVRISFREEMLIEQMVGLTENGAGLAFDLRKCLHLWSPENPNLYEVQFTLLEQGRERDRVDSYFGMRKISIHDGRICLNNKPYYMKLVLDQGYFPDGILTAPSDESLANDVRLTKDMGFNGARKHQKVEDPRYLYWCDRMGLLVWGEMANAYHYSDAYVRRMTAEWQEAIARDYNHPCIVAWVPINESWGVPDVKHDPSQQHHAMTMYHLTKSLDPTRLVVSNEGWEHAVSDMCTIHDYEGSREVLAQRYATVESTVGSQPHNRPIYANGFAYRGEPILLSEFGGIRLRGDRISKDSVQDDPGQDDSQDFIARLRNVIEPVQSSPALQGYCYTQLTDVEQEKNGLLTYDRKPKVHLAIIKEINERGFPYGR